MENIPPSRGFDPVLPTSTEQIQQKSISLSEAALLIGRIHGQKPSYTTLWRWAKKGLNGHILETIRIGRTFRTTPAAIDRFLKRERVTEPPSNNQKQQQNDCFPTVNNMTSENKNKDYSKKRLKELRYPKTNKKSEIFDS